MHPFRSRSESSQSSKLKSMVGPDSYAKGGRVKKDAKTHINIMVAPQSPQHAMPPPMPPGPPAQGAMPPPPVPTGGLPPARPNPAPLPGGAMGMPAVNAMPLRKSGGRVKGGMTPVKAESVKAGTKVQHTPDKVEGPLYSKPPALTRAKGGRARPKMTAGGYSGEGRLQKAAMQKKSYP